MKKLSVLLLGMALFGCAGAKTVRPESIKSETKQPAKQAVISDGSDDYTAADYRRAVNAAVANMIRSGALDNPGGDKYVVVVRRVVNMTKKEFNTSEIVQGLKSALGSSRKVRVVSERAKETESQIAVSGKITHRVAHVRGMERQEYYLHLNLTEVKTGTGLWDGVTPIIHKAVPQPKDKNPK